MPEGLSHSEARTVSESRHIASSQPQSASDAGVRIVEVRQRAVPLESEISNAYISFARMTASAVAVISNVIRDGRPVDGFGFN